MRLSGSGPTAYLSGEPNCIGVLVKRLDDEAASWDRLDLMRVDVNGFEPFVLVGARVTIARLRPSLLVRVDAPQLARYRQNPVSLMSVIASLHYVIEPLDEAKPDALVYDVLCTPAEKMS